jgi:hypothetical protein
MCSASSILPNGLRAEPGQIGHRGRAAEIEPDEIYERYLGIAS